MLSLKGAAVAMVGLSLVAFAVFSFWARVNPTDPIVVTGVPIAECSSGQRITCVVDGDMLLREGLARY